MRNLARIFMGYIARSVVCNLQALMYKSQSAHQQLKSHEELMFQFKSKDRRILISQLKQSGEGVPSYCRGTTFLFGFL